MQRTVFLYGLIKARALDDAKTAHEQNLPRRDLHDVIHVFAIPAAAIEIVDADFIVEIQIELLK